MMQAGWGQAAIAFGLGGSALWIVVVTASVHRDAVGQIALLALAMLVIGLLAGSVSLVGAASAPALGSVMVEVLSEADQSWVRSIVIGCLWYVVVELAWDAIDRRDVASRSRAAAMRRAQEVVTVVTLSLVVGLGSLVLSSLAPVRTLPVQALILICFFAALLFAVRHLADTPDNADASDKTAMTSSLQ